MKKDFKSISISIFVIITIAIVVITCNNQELDQKRAVEKASKNILKTLYEPPGVNFLSEKMVTYRNKNYKNCIVTETIRIYGTESSFTDVLANYRTGLQKQGWEQNPNYTHNSNDFDIFSLTPQTSLRISAEFVGTLYLSTPTDESADQNISFYYLLFSYYYPDELSCSG